MKKILVILLVNICFPAVMHAQLTTLPDGGNKKAWVGERVGLTDITIQYSRPGVKGREGKIWGQLVAAGFNDLGFGTSKASPWRAGANENTSIQFSTDVSIEGQSLKAGVYGLFIAYDKNEPILIFSKNATSWGSYFYDAKEDALRVPLKTAQLDQPVEWLKYEFMNQTENSATIALLWEKLMFPFKVEVDYIGTQMEVYRKELRGEKSFNPGWQAFQQAARFTVDRNTNLEEGLNWANQSISTPFIGDVNFLTLSTKADILTKLGRNREADSMMKKALPLGNMQQLHAYGRQLLQLKKFKDALQVFQLNYQKNPNQFTPAMGLVRGYSANGDYKNALKYAQIALPLSPAGPNKTNVETMIEKLKKGQDVN